MVEFGRLAQLERLKARGWHEDAECRELREGLHAGGHRFGGPSFLKSPEGVVHAVSCGTETPVDGGRTAMIGGRPTPTLYRGGRRIAIRG